MVNTKHDTTSYENCGYQREIFDGNALYEAYKRARKGSDWKPQVQKFEMNYLLELANMQKALKDKSYELLPTTSFMLHERGKIRHITGEQIQDRIVKHALCDEILNPAIEKYLIFDNGASLVGKGIDFTRRRLLRKTVDRSKVDVSYMTDDEYENCMNRLFNSLVYQYIDKSLLTGEKFMAKHLNIGDQVAQTAGIAYPIRIDNYIKIVRSVKFYGRYMDDSYIIHESKEFLLELLEEIIEIAREIGITVNTRKTRVCKLSEHWRFLQVQYSLTDTGRVIQKINPKRLTGMRRKMKKLAPKLSEKEFTDWYKSWFKNHYRIMSRQQRSNMDTLFNQLKEVTKCSTQSPSPMVAS